MADYVSPQRTHGLVDILDRVLDKGLVIAERAAVHPADRLVLQDCAQKLDHRQYETRESVLDVLGVGVDPAGQSSRQLAQLLLERGFPTGRNVDDRPPGRARVVATGRRAVLSVLVGHRLTLRGSRQSCRAPTGRR